MFPIRDDNPHFLPPLVTVGLIVMNAASWLLIQGLGTRLVVTPDRPEDFLEVFRQMVDSPLLQSSAHE